MEKNIWELVYGMNTSSTKISLLGTIRESFGRVVYSHKTHEKMAEILESRKSTSTIIEIIAIALIGSGLISLHFYDETLIKFIAALLAFLSLGLTLYKAFANLDIKISANQKTACRLWLIREKYTNLISDLSEERITDTEAQEKRNELQTEAYKIYEDAPQTNSSAYKTAQKALKDNEDFTFSNEEIDRFLPQTP